MGNRPAFLATFCLLIVLLPTNAFATDSASDESQDSLLRRVRSTQVGAVRLLEGLYASEESLLLPANDRLLVVFLKQDADVQALLHKVEFRIDNRVLQVYAHQIGDLEKMTNGAVIPLHATLLSAGKHTCGVSITGLDNDDSDGPAEATFSFVSGPQSHFIEVRITRDGIQFRDWR